jgi:hypothetical protein
MNLAEVKREYEQGDGGFHVVPLAAESVRQPRHAAHTHPNRKIDALHMARANQGAVRVADLRLNDSALQFGRRVARRAFCHSSVNLNQLTIIDAGSQTERHRVWISGHAISRKLKLSQRGLVQLLDKDFSIYAGASAKMPSKDDLAVALDCEERPRIALALVIQVALVPFLAKAKAPQLIGLYVRHGYFADVLLQNGLALVTGDLEDAKHGRDRNVAQSGRAANATAFAQTIENAVEFFIRQVDRSNGFDGARRKRLSALAASKSGRSVLAVKAVRLRAVDFTGWTIHSVTQSFLTETLFEPSIMVTGLDWRQQRQSGLRLRGMFKHPSESRLGLAATVGFKPTEPEGSADLQSAPLDRSGTSPLIQKSSRLLFLSFKFPNTFSLIHLVNSLVRLLRLSFLASPFLQILTPSGIGFSLLGSNSVACFVSHCDHRNLATFFKSFQDSVDTRKRVTVLRQVVGAGVKRVPYLRSRHITLTGLQHCATGVGQVGVSANYKVTHYPFDHFQRLIGSEGRYAVKQLLYLRQLVQRIRSLGIQGIKPLAHNFSALQRYLFNFFPILFSHNGGIIHAKPTRVYKIKQVWQ